MTTGGFEEDKLGDPSTDLSSSITQRDPDYSKQNKITSLFFLLLIIIILIVLWQWISGTPKQKTLNEPPLVVLTTPKRMDVPVYLNALGSVTPLDTVTVITQVDGQLLKVFFKEGQLVKANEVLAQIDPRPFEAVLLQAQGDLERDMATLQNARLDLARYVTLWTQDSVAKQVLDTQRALVKQLEGTVKMDRGLVAAAHVNLDFCRITSPINGRVGLRLVDPGNFVQTTNTTGLFVLNTINPTTVIFTLAEDFLPQVLSKIKAGEELIADAFDRNQNKLLATGKLFAVDNLIDPTTGTVKLKAKFCNDNDILFPSQFVNIRLKVDTLKNAILIPTTALLHGKQEYVYGFDANNHTAHVKPVKTGISFGDNTVITSGVSTEDVLIAQGTDSLKEGATVRVSSTNANVIPPKQSKAKRDVS